MFENSNLTNNKFSRSIIISLVSSLIIAIFLWCGLFAIPSADDYFYANFAKDNGLFGAQVKHYVEWSGRYIATFLITLFSITDYEYYWIGPWFCILSLLISLYFIIKTVFVQIVDQLHPFRLTLSFLALFLSIATAGYGHGVSVINEGFFWFSGAITYSGSLSLYLFLMALIVKMIRQENAATNFILTIMLTVLVVGLNETAMFLVCITLIPILLRFGDKIGWKKAITLITIIIICSLVVFLAPGNDVRMQTSDGGNVLSAVGVCLEKVTQIFFYYLFNPFIWVFMIVEKRQIETILSWSGRYINNRVINLLGGILVFFLYMPIAYSLNSGAPDRLIAFIGFFALLVSIVYTYSLFSWKIKFIKKNSRKMLSLLLSVSILGSYFFLEPLRIAIITTFTGPGYYQEHIGRRNYVRNEVKDGRYRVHVRDIERNRLLLFEDLLPQNPNKEYARFNGAKVVKVVERKSIQQ